MTTESDSDQPIPLRAGALRYQDKDNPGRWIVCNPHDCLYSTVTMLATEYWTGERWKPIYSDNQ